MQTAKRYSYNGPVMEFNRCVANKWFGETIAVSPEKAKSNLIFQFKRQTGKVVGTKISLPGKIWAL